MGNRPLLVQQTHDATLFWQTTPARLRWRSRGFPCGALKRWTSRGTVGSNEQEPLMKSGVSCVALGFGLLTETLFAMGQTIRPPFVVAQGPSSAPPSGVLMTPPLSPVAVPPSGVLMPPPTVERHAITTVPVKTAQTKQIARSATRRSVPRASSTRRKIIARATTVDQIITPIPSVISAAAEEPRNNGTGYELFLSQFGKAKETQ